MAKNRPRSVKERKKRLRAIYITLVAGVVAALLALVAQGTTAAVVLYNIPSNSLVVTLFAFLGILDVFFVFEFRAKRYLTSLVLLWAYLGAELVFYVYIQNWFWSIIVGALLVATLWTE